MFNALYTLLALFLVFTESMHVCNLILTHMYFMHSDLPLNPGVTPSSRSPSQHSPPVGTKPEAKKPRVHEGMEAGAEAVRLLFPV
jgi:hypothetical protein